MSVRGDWINFVNYWLLSYMSSVVSCHNVKISVQYQVKYNIIPNFFQKQGGIFIPLEVLAWAMLSFIFWIYLLLEKYEYLQHFVFFKVDFKKQNKTKQNHSTVACGTL